MTSTPSCSTLITSHCNAEIAYFVNRVAVRTHQSTAGHLSKLHFWDHDITDERLSGLMRREVEDLGGIYTAISEPYHQTRYWNNFMRSCGTDYAVLSSADVIFHTHWLYNLLRCYEAHPELLSLHPVTFSSWHCGQSYFCSASERSDILIQTANPLCHVIVHRIANRWFWDEQFPYWEADMDYQLHLERSGKRAGIVTSSHVDHLEGSIIRNESSKGICHLDAAEARRRLEIKWGLPPVA